MRAGAWVVALSSLFGLCSAADIAIDHIEFVQVVQDRDNHVPLVAGKSTVVRVFLTSSGDDGQDVASGIGGTLTADRFPETLKPFGDLPAIAPAAAPDQNNQRHSLNFLLPPAWTNPSGGNLQVRAAVTLDSGQRVQTALASFQTPSWPPVFRVAHLEVCVPDADNNLQCPASFGDVSEFMQKTYPLADGAAEYNPIAAGAVGLPGNLVLHADPNDTSLATYFRQIQFTRFLASYYFLLEQAAPPDQLFAWFPLVDGVAGLAEFATPRNAGLGHVWWGVGNCIAVRCPDGDKQALGRTLASSIAYNLGLRAGAGLVTGGFDPRAGKVVPASTPEPLTVLGAWPSAATFQALFNIDLIFPTGIVPASADYLMIGGVVSLDGSVAQLDPGYHVPLLSPAPPSDRAGTHCLRFSGGAAADYCFSPFFLDPTDPTGIGGFQLKALFPPGTTRVALIRRDSAAGDSELTAITASVQAPTLSIIAPSAGDVWQGKRSLQWTAADPGGAPLVYAVQYSADNGASWTPLAIDWRDTQLEVDSTRIWGGSQVLFRVLASSGLNTANAIVGPITVLQTPKLASDQTTLNFQNVPVGQAADRTLLLRNTGTGPLTVAGQISSGPFALLSAANLVIPAGEERAIAVRWIPTATGSQQGALTLTSSDPSLPSVNIGLAGVAFDSQAPAISLSATSVDFGSVISGQTKDLKLTTTNSGGAPLTVSAITSSNARFSVVTPALPVTIAAGQSADVTVRFAPNTTGPVSGALSISSNDPARNVATIAVTGTGVTGTQSPSISAAPTSLDFGAVTAGFSKDSKFTISNAGTGDLTVRSISSSSAAFIIVAPAAPFTVAAGRPVDVTVRFAPSTGGAVSASLTIASSDPSRPSITIALSGNGVASVPATVLRTIGYHEIASPSPPLDYYNQPAISRNGARAAFTVNANDLWVINTDGSGSRQIDSFSFPNPRFIGVSDDGSKVLVWHPQFLRIANADGSPAQTLLADNTSASIQEARLTGDGRTVFFVVRNETTLTIANSSRLAARGVWAINADGSGLRQVIAAGDVSRLLGGEAAEMVADGSYPGELGVSINGSRVAFGVTASSTRRRFVLGVNGDGTGVHVIRGPLAFLYAIGISGDGSTVAYSARVQSSVAPEVDAIRFDGTGGMTLSASVGAASLQVSNDGLLVFSGGAGNGLLWRADGSSLVELFAPRWGNAPQLVYENADINRATMNGDGTKFLFTSPATSGAISLATADINPSSLGAAPAITAAAIDPTSVPSDGRGYSVIITARVSATIPVSGGSAQSFLQGLPELAGTPMTDTGGGAWAGSVYQTSTVTGPRVIRIKMETQSTDGKRHATAVDLGGFTVR